MKIKFVANPTGQFNLSYNAGDEVIMETKQAMLLIEAGYAVEIPALTSSAKPTKKVKPINPEIELDAE
jgi:hypothetical protein